MVKIEESYSEFNFQWQIVMLQTKDMTKKVYKLKPMLGVDEFMSKFPVWKHREVLKNIFEWRREIAKAKDLAEEGVLSGRRTQAMAKELPSSVEQLRRYVISEYIMDTELANLLSIIKSGAQYSDRNPRLRSVVRKVTVPTHGPSDRNDLKSSVQPDLVDRLEEMLNEQEHSDDRNVEEFDMDVLEVTVPNNEFDSSSESNPGKKKWPCYLCYEFGHVRPECPLKGHRNSREVQIRIATSKANFFESNPKLRSRERKRRNANYSQNVNKRIRTMDDRGVRRPL